MTGVHIRVRQRKTGKRYEVRYRKGGGGWPLVSAGTFKTRKLAMIRHDLVAGWLAAGKDPKVELLAMLAEAPPTRVLSEWQEMFMRSRFDLSVSTRRVYDATFRQAREFFGDRDPLLITVPEVRDFVGFLVDQELQATTVAQYVQKLKVFLDFIEAKPNPARDRSVKLPRKTHVEHVPPPAAHVIAILENVWSPRVKLGLVVMEQTAMRPGEVETLVWGDVDVPGNRFRIRGEETKTSRSRWVQVPGWLMDVIAARTPYDDRTATRRVFPGFSPSGAQQAITTACKRAGIPHYSPKSFRHRRASIWHHVDRLSTADLALRGGWVSKAVPLEVYSHVLMDGSELSAERLTKVLL